MIKYENNQRDLAFFKARRAKFNSLRRSVYSVEYFDCPCCGLQVFRLMGDIDLFNVYNVIERVIQHNVLETKRVSHDCNMVLPDGWHYRITPQWKVEASQNKVGCY